MTLEEFKKLKPLTREDFDKAKPIVDSTDTKVRRFPTYRLGKGVLNTGIGLTQSLLNRVAEVSPNSNGATLAELLNNYVKNDNEADTKALHGHELLKLYDAAGFAMSPLSKLLFAGSLKAANALPKLPKYVKNVAAGAPIGVGSALMTPNLNNTKDDLVKDSVAFNMAMPAITGIVSPLISGAGSVISKVLGGGAGIDKAYEAGRLGGAANEAFQKAYHGDVSKQEVTEKINEEVAKYHGAMSEGYDIAKQEVFKPSGINVASEDINTLIQALKEAKRVGQDVSGRDFSPDVLAAKDFVENLVDNYRSSLQQPPNRDLVNLRTLQRALQDLAQKLNKGGNIPAQQKVPTIVANSIDKILKEKLPGFEPLQEKYAKQEAVLKQLKDSLGLDGTKSINLETATNKIQKIPGSEFKQGVLKPLEDVDPTLPYLVAGTRAKDLLPVGQGKSMFMATAIYPLMHLLNDGDISNSALATAALLSPKLVGGAANLAGSMSRGSANATKAATAMPYLGLEGYPKLTLQQLVNQLILDNNKATNYGNRLYNN